jgi:hypothetical protein
MSTKKVKSNKTKIGKKLIVGELFFSQLRESLTDILKIAEGTTDKKQYIHELSVYADVSATTLSKLVSGKYRPERVHAGTIFKLQLLLDAYNHSYVYSAEAERESITSTKVLTYLDKPNPLDLHAMLRFVYSEHTGDWYDMDSELFRLYAVKYKGNYDEVLQNFSDRKAAESSAKIAADDAELASEKCLDKAIIIQNIVVQSMDISIPIPSEYCEALDQVQDTPYAQSSELVRKRLLPLSHVELRKYAIEMPVDSLTEEDVAELSRKVHVWGEMLNLQKSVLDWK